MELPERKEDRVAIVERMYFEGQGKHPTDIALLLDICKQTGLSIRTVKGFKSQYRWGLRVQEMLAGRAAGLRDVMTADEWDDFNREPGKPGRPLGSRKPRPDAPPPRKKGDKPKPPRPRKQMRKIRIKQGKVRDWEAKPDTAAVQKIARTAQIPVLRQDRQTYFAERTGMPVVKKQGFNYTEDEKAEALRYICEYYGMGLWSLPDLCEAQGIDYITFNRWVAQNEYFYAMFQQAKDRHDIGFTGLMDEYMKALFLENMKERFTEEERVNYEARVRPDVATGTFTTVFIPVSKNVTRRPIRPDASSMGFLQEHIKEMRARAQKNPTSDMGKYEQYNAAQLDMEIAATEAELTRARNRTSEEGVSEGEAGAGE